MSVRRSGFTLVELLVVVAIIAILAAVLFPVFARAKEKSKQTVCLSNMRQLGSGLKIYMLDSDEKLPDRRDLKASLPGGYRPWTSWPPSDPRAGWAAVVLAEYWSDWKMASCPASSAIFESTVQVMQPTTNGSNLQRTSLWMWRFDRMDDPVPLDNLWGKSESQAVDDLVRANNPQVGRPDGPADVEIAVDPYFPKTIGSIPDDLKGKAVHFGGRNRLFLDLHSKFLKDARTNR
ncbi:MAG: type II secretion system protein [Fimbriimonadales bacterium]